MQTISQSRSKHTSSAFDRWRNQCASMHNTLHSAKEHINTIRLHKNNSIQITRGKEVLKIEQALVFKQTRQDSKVISEEMQVTEESDSEEEQQEQTDNVNNP